MMRSRSLVLLGGTIVVIAVLVVVLVVVSSSGDGEDTAAVQQTIPTVAPSAATQAPPSPTATLPPPTATSEPPTPTPEPAQLANRTNCDQIRGTAYRSDAERQFFLENCSGAPQPETGSPETITAPPQNTPCETHISILSDYVTKTYPVTGSSFEEVLASLESNAPQLDGQPAYGLTEWQMSLSGDFCVSEGSCSIGALEIDASGIITLPAHVDPASIDPALRPGWDVYVESVTIHEGRHATIAIDGAKALEMRLLGLSSETTCDALEHEIDKAHTIVFSETRSRQTNFHIADRLGLAGSVVQ